MLQFARPQDARQRLRARLHHAVAARRCRSRAAPASRRCATSSSGMNPEWLRYYIAAKLNAQRRGHRLQPRRLRRARQQRPGRQVRQHRAAARPASSPSLRRQAVRGPLGRARCCIELQAGRAEDRRALRGARVRQGAARDHGAADLVNAVRRAAQAVGAREGARRTTRQLHDVLHASACNVFRLLTLYLKPVLPAVARAGRGIPGHRGRCSGAMPRTCAASTTRIGDIHST